MFNLKPLLGACLASASCLAAIQSDAPSEYAVKEREAHINIWERRTTGSDGREVLHRYKQIQSGLNRFSEAENRWAPAQLGIEIENGKGYLRNTAHKIVFDDFTANWPIQLQFSHPDKRWLKARPRGIAMTSITTGRSVWVSEADTASTGALDGTNVVSYASAFAPIAGLRVKTRLDGLESDVVFNEQLATPATLGFQAAEDIRVEIWTAMEGPAPGTRTNNQIPGTLFVDQEIYVGNMLFGMGLVFVDDGSGQPPTLAANRQVFPSAKQWFHDEGTGQSFLIESLSYSDVARLLQGLPPSTARYDPAQAKFRSQVAQNKRQIPRSIALAARADPQNGKAAALPHQDKAENLDKSLGGKSFAGIGRGSSSPAVTPGKQVIWDYVLLANSTNFTFQSDCEYLVTDNAILSGVTTLEGGSCIKSVIRTNTTPELACYGPVYCATSMFRPAYFSCIDDDTVGSALPGSTGSPSGFNYAYRALLIYDPGADIYLHDLQFRYALISASLYYCNAELRNVSFVNSG